MVDYLCKTPLFDSVTSNSSLSEVVTPCLAFVLLPGIVAAFSTTCLIFLLFYGYITSEKHLRLGGKLLVIKKILGCMIILSNIIQLGLISVAEKNVMPEPIIGKIFGCIFALTAFGSYLQCCRCGIPSSIWLHLVFLLRLFSMVPEAIAAIGVLKLNSVFLSFFGIEVLSIILLVIFFCFAEKLGNDYDSYHHGKLQQVDPDRRQSSLSRIFFAHGFGLMAKGYQRAIDYNTFWSLDPRNDPQNLISSYHKHFNNTTTVNNGYIPWLLVILIKCKWLQFSASIILSLLSALFVITDPLLLKLIITASEDRYPLWCGLVLVLVTFVTTMTRFVLTARSDFYCLLIFTDIQTILLNAIYRKMLKLPGHVKVKYSAGQLVNLLNTDISMIRTLVYTLPEFVSTTVTLVCCMVGLYFVIGINVLYGLGIIAICLPVNGFGFTLSSYFQRKQMKLKDDRLKLVTDVLSGIKVLKLYAWERPMRALIAKNRQKEMRYQRYMLYCSSLTGIAFNAYPILATIVSLIGYLIVQGHPLTPQVAFLSLMLFNLMRPAVYRLPNLIQNAINARISFVRVQNFLLEPEIPLLMNTFKPLEDDTVTEMRDADFSWGPPQTTPSVLKSLTFSISEGKLVGVIGSVASSKSSFLNAICGELYLSSGDIYRKPSLSIAYVSQEPWIQNMSLRDNILFGKPFDEPRYRKVLHACALIADLKILPAGDITEIGEKGLNLSGGQKARVALARAVYQNADLYVLDDTLSAVDSHVGAHIFKNVIGNEGLLRGKTRIFALNSIGFLASCDQIIILKDGEIVDSGTFGSLRRKNTKEFMKLVREFTVIADKKAKEETDAHYVLEENDLSKKPPIIEHRISVCSKNSETPDFETSHNKGLLIEDEKMAVGKVAFKMYWDYIKSFGIVLALAYFITLFVIRTFLESYSQIWMSKWSSNYGNTSEVSNLKGLEVYGAFGVSSCLVVAISSIIMAFGSYNASIKLYDGLLYSLLRSPLEFFDRTPMGRILNRLSNDIETIDFAISKKLGYVAKVAADCGFYTLSAVYVMPQLGVLILPVIIIAVVVVRLYTIAVVQIRRLASKSWSSVMSQATESYNGTSSIRIFQAQKSFKKELLRKNKVTAESWLAENVANRWMMVLMDMITAFFSLGLTGGAVYFGYTGALSAGSVALVASTGSMLRGLLGEITRQLNNLEMSLVAVERVQEYVDNEHEAEWVSSRPIPPDWPADGGLKFVNFSLRYRATLPLVLKNLSLEISPGKKIGIVGRTGAGKTSLTLALFRIIEPAAGTIFIGNIDFRTLGLHQLRQALTIIPQDPVLFCGTLRINLDPFDEFDDSVLWEAIEKAHLSSFVEKFPDKLNHRISEGGSNLSVGQRQLICLARAILRKQTKILILDEATASIDVETDQLIQRSIRSQFGECTILTIAHRLNTIMDYDRIIAMEEGAIREFDTPEELLRNKDGLFYSLAREAKLV